MESVRKSYTSELIKLPSYTNGTDILAVLFGSMYYVFAGLVDADGKKIKMPFVHENDEEANGNYFIPIDAAMKAVASGVYHCTTNPKGYVVFGECGYINVKKGVGYRPPTYDIELGWCHNGRPINFQGQGQLLCGTKYDHTKTSNIRINELLQYLRHLKEQGITHVTVVQMINNSKVAWTDAIFDNVEEGTYVVDIGSGGGCTVYERLGQVVDKTLGGDKKGKMTGITDEGDVLNVEKTAKAWVGHLVDAEIGLGEFTKWAFVSTNKNMRANPQIFRDLLEALKGHGFNIVEEHSQVLAGSDEALSGSKSAISKLHVAIKNKGFKHVLVVEAGSGSSQYSEWTTDVYNVNLRCTNMFGTAKRAYVNQQIVPVPHPENNNVYDSFRFYYPMGHETCVQNTRDLDFRVYDVRAPGQTKNTLDQKAVKLMLTQHREVKTTIWKAIAGVLSLFIYTACTESLYVPDYYMAMNKGDDAWAFMDLLRDTEHKLPQKATEEKVEESETDDDYHQHGSFAAVQQKVDLVNVRYCNPKVLSEEVVTFPGYDAALEAMEGPAQSNSLTGIGIISSWGDEDWGTGLLESNTQERTYINIAQLMFAAPHGRRIM